MSRAGAGHGSGPVRDRSGALVGWTLCGAVTAWGVTGIVRVVWPRMAEYDGIGPTLTGMFSLLVCFVLFVVTCVAAVATLLVAVAWFRGPTRRAVPAASLAHAVVAWAVMAFVLLRDL